MGRAEGVAGLAAGEPELVVSHPFNDDAVEWMGHGAVVVG